MKLLGKSVAEKLSQNIKLYISENGLTDVYIVDFWLNKNDGSEKYVEAKTKYGQSIWINVKVDSEYSNYLNIYEKIHRYNADPNCLGILFQLPLPEDLKAFAKDIFALIDPRKDIDWHTASIFGAWAMWYSDVLPATAASIVNILSYYDLAEVKWKTVLVIWQSNLVGKPLANRFINNWSTVISANIYTTQESLVEYCQKADIIVSATGDLHFLDREYIYSDREQILIDVGYGYINAKAAGDINFDDINLENKKYTPVPGGVGPVTVASLFDNIIKLSKTNFVTKCQ